MSDVQVAASSEIVPTATKPLPLATTAFTCAAPSVGKLLISCQPAPLTLPLDGSAEPPGAGVVFGLTLDAAQPATRSSSNVKARKFRSTRANDTAARC